MHKSILRVTVLILVMSSVGCVGTRNFYEKAAFDKDIAHDAIENIQKDGLILLLPTEHKKEKLLQRAGNKNRLNKLIERRDAINQSLASAFMEQFDFAEVYIMPDSLFYDYAENKDGVYFLNKNMELDAAITYDVDDPYKIILYDSKYLECLRGNEVVANPFPNRHNLGFYIDDVSLLQRLFMGGNNHWSEAQLKEKVMDYNSRFVNFSKRSKDVRYFDID